MKASSRFIAICALFGAGLTWVDFAGVVFSAPRPKPLSAPPMKPPATPANSFVANEVLVKFKPIRSGQDRITAAGVRGHGVLKDLRRPGWSQIRIRANETVDQALAAYQNDPDVEHAQPNYIYRAAAVPNDPHHGQLWALKNIGQTVAGDYLPNSGTPGADLNIEKAWDHITDCSSVVVAVIDTGVNYNHEDLAGNMWNGAPDFPKHGADFVDSDNDPMDFNGHGSRVAAIIGAAGNNATGTAGVCWKASLMALRALDARGIGNTATIIQAINFAVNHGAKVLNMSLGGRQGFDQALSDAIENARANDVVVVLAAGNDAANMDRLPVVHEGSDPDPGFGFHPCKLAHANLLCVTALTQGYGLSNFSNWGMNSVDVGAPGTNILSATAGAWSRVEDNFTESQQEWAVSGGGWGFITNPPSDATGGGDFWLLANPTSLFDHGGQIPQGGSYANNADQRVYRHFNVSGKAAAKLNFKITPWVSLGDVLNLNFRNGGGDPFAGGVLLDNFQASSDACGEPGSLGPISVYSCSYDISACAGATCSVGFQLLSDAVHDGGAIFLWGFPGLPGFALSVDMLQPNNTTYETLNGTSMAAAYAAGLAAMLRAYNPQYRYADVISAIKNGGRPTAALQNATSTGNAVDFMSSLAHINAPTGLRAAVAQ